MGLDCVQGRGRAMPGGEAACGQVEKSFEDHTERVHSLFQGFQGAITDS